MLPGVKAKGEEVGFWRMLLDARVVEVVVDVVGKEMVLHIQMEVGEAMVEITKQLW